MAAGGMLGGLANAYPQNFQPFQQVYWAEANKTFMKSPLPPVKKPTVKKVIKKFTGKIDSVKLDHLPPYLRIMADEMLAEKFA